MPVFDAKLDWLLIGSLLAAGLGAPALAAPTADPSAAIRQRAAEVFDDPFVQAEFPVEPAETYLPPLRLRRLMLPRSVVLIVATLVLVAAAIALVVMGAGSWRQRRRGGDHHATADPARGPGSETLPDYMALAAEGRLAEAAHALLLRVMAELERRSGKRHPRSLTSRELLRCYHLDDDQRQALGELILTVEEIHFGRAGCPRERWENLLALSRTLAPAGKPPR